MPGHFFQLPESADFFGTAQPLADKGFIFQHPELQQIGGDDRRIVNVICQQRHLVPAVNPLGQPRNRSPVQTDQLRILPAVTKPGKSKLYTAVMRNHLDMLRSEPPDQIAGNSKKQRVTGGKHHRLTLSIDPRQLVNKGLQSALQDDFLPAVPAEERQLPFPAEQYLALLHSA
ncbi:hypothetical protein D3C86_1619690 [compost metagenome]